MHPVTSRGEDDPFAAGMAAWTEADDQALAGYRDWQFDLIQPFLGRRLLEIGAGFGMMADIVCRRHRFERYVALEPSPHFYGRLQHRLSAHPGCEARQGTIEAIEASEAGAFDTIFSIHVLEHVDDDAGFVRRAYDLLAPGGRLIILVPALPALYSRLDRRVGHVRRYDRGRIQALAAGVGATLALNRYDNLIGAVGWWWLCRVRGLDYHSSGRRQTLVSRFRFFSEHILPMAAAIERRLPPPVGLNLTAVLEKR